MLDHDNFARGQIPEYRIRKQVYIVCGERGDPMGTHGGSSSATRREGYSIPAPTPCSTVLAPPTMDRNRGSHDEAAAAGFLTGVDGAAPALHTDP